MKGTIAALVQLSPLYFQLNSESDRPYPIGDRLPVGWKSSESTLIQ